MSRHRTKISAIAGSMLALSLFTSTGTVAAGQSTRAEAAPAHFMVLGPTGDGLQQTAESVRAAGGQVVQTWPKIGVIVATSTDPGFAKDVRTRPAVDQAGASRNLVERMPPQQPNKRLEPLDGTVSEPAVEAKEGEPLEPDQWDLRKIKADQAAEISQGSKDVTVGVLDYGIDPTHPDLAPNLDVSKSVSCANEGVPDTSQEAWAPENMDQAHGSHVAGTIAAARNGVGVAGVAPNVSLASVRIIDDKGFIYPEYAVCGFQWAAEHGFDVTNNSYFVDPWYVWCSTDPDQKASAEAVRRAVAYASGKDVVSVVASGNENHDMSKPVHDTMSPNNGGPTQDRWTGPECQNIPGELPGVVNVSSIGTQSVKSYFSNYGLDSVTAAAPGGDKNQIPDTPSGNGQVLSTVPEGGWGWMQGTSMASPHAAGVVALLRSTHPEWTAAQSVGALTKQADTLPCPENYDPDGDGKPDAVCEGGDTGAGFYGAGVVDALDAVR